MLWKDNYAIGVAEVDSQHQELFHRLNSFLTTVRSERSMGDKLEEIHKTLDFMGEYVVIHFTAEEEVQKRYGYPYREQHHQIHEEFKDYIRNFKEKFADDPGNVDLIMEFSGRLLTWLINHVTGEDQNIADYVTEEAE